MDGRRFGDVHDFAIGRDDKYETVQGLQQMGAKLFDGADGGRRLLCSERVLLLILRTTPRIAKSCDMNMKVTILL